MDAPNTQLLQYMVKALHPVYALPESAYLAQIIRLQDLDSVPMPIEPQAAMLLLKKGLVFMMCRCSAALETRGIEVKTTGRGKHKYFMGSNEKGIAPAVGAVGCQVLREVIHPMIVEGRVPMDSQNKLFAAHDAWMGSGFRGSKASHKTAQALWAIAGCGDAAGCVAALKEARATSARARSLPSHPCALPSTRTHARTNANRSKDHSHETHDCNGLRNH